MLRLVVRKHFNGPLELIVQGLEQCFLDQPCDQIAGAQKISRWRALVYPKLIAARDMPRVQKVRQFPQRLES
jgi:hypothetical protein